jgi:D-amino-acid dehydrogenase
MSGSRVLVAGSGVAGAGVAYALACGGAAVTVVDSGMDGQATAAGAGIVQPWSSATTGALHDLSAAAAEFYPALLAELSELGVRDVGYRRRGSLIVDAQEPHLAAVAERLAVRAARSPTVGPVSRLGPGEARRMFPPLADELAALYVPGGARVDGRRVRNGLLAAAAQRGAQVKPATVRLVQGPGGSTRATVDGDPHPADAVVVAAGAWTNRLLSPLGVQLPLAPQRGQISHLHLPATPTDEWPSVHTTLGHYLVAFEDGRVVAGATRETGSGWDARVTAAGQHLILADALRIAPGLAEATLLETRVGLRPLAADGLPLVGRLLHQPHVFVATGFGPVGLTLGPYVGQLLAEAILEVSDGGELAPFSPSRVTPEA